MVEKVNHKNKIWRYIRLRSLSKILPYTPYNFKLAVSLVSMSQCNFRSFITVLVIWLNPIDYIKLLFTPFFLTRL